MTKENVLQPRLSHIVMISLAILLTISCHVGGPKAWKTKEGVFLRTGPDYWVVVLDNAYVSRLMDISPSLSSGTYYVAYMGYTTTGGGGSSIEGELSIQQAPLCLVLPEGKGAERRIHDYTIYSRQSKTSVFLEIQPLTRKITCRGSAKLPVGVVEREGPQGTLFLETQGSDKIDKKELGPES